jgi:hypothetical protein
MWGISGSGQGQFGLLFSRRRRRRRRRRRTATGRPGYLPKILSQ